jgi:hypothetical protein
VGALGVVAATLLTLGLCGFASGRDIPALGPVLSCLSPLNLALAAVGPATAVPASLKDPQAASLAFLLGATAAVIAYVATTMAMHAAMRRNFMMTVRRLAGLK